MKQTPPELIARRKAAEAVRLVQKDANIPPTLLEPIQSDDDDQWAVEDTHHLRCLSGRDVIAWVELTFQEPQMARVDVPNPYLLVNQSHRSEFAPWEYGFGPRKVDFLGEPEAYSFLVELPTTIPGLYSPKRYIPRRRGTRKWKVKRQL